MATGGEALGRAALALPLLVLPYYGFSIGITFYNKWLMKVRGGGAVRGCRGRAAAVTAAVGPAELPLPAARLPAAPPAHLRALGAAPRPGALPLGAPAGGALLGRLPAPGGARRYGGGEGGEGPGPGLGAACAASAAGARPGAAFACGSRTGGGCGAGEVRSGGRQAALRGCGRCRGCRRRSEL